MRNLRPIIIVMALIIFICIGLVPWVDGILFKQKYLQTVQVINQYHRVKIDVLDYQLGWFSSSAKINVTPLTASSQPLSPVSMIIENNITHGPLVTDKATNHLQLAYAGIQSFVHYPEIIIALNQGAVPPVEMNTLAAFNGQWTNQIHMPSLTLSMPDSGKLTWQGLKGHFNFLVSGQEVTSYTVDLKAGTLTLTTNGLFPFVGEATMQGFNYQSQVMRQLNGLWGGTSNLTIPNITIKKADGTSNEANHFSFTSLLTGKSATSYRFNMNMLLQSLHVPNPFVSDVSNVTLSMTIDNANLQAAQALQQAMPTTQFKNMTAEEERTFARIFNPGTTIDERFSVNTPLGEASVMATALWNATVSPASLSDLEANMDVTIQLKAATALIDHIFSTFDSMMGALATPVNSSSTSTPNKDAYTQLVALLLQQGQITLPQSLDLIGLYDNHHTPQEFDSVVDKMGLTANTVVLLKQQYVSSSNKAAAANAAAKTPAATPIPTQIQSSQMQQMLARWIQEGYVVQDNNAYALTITRKTGNIFINGKAFPDANNTLIQLLR